MNYHYLGGPAEIAAGLLAGWLLTASWAKLRSPSSTTNLLQKTLVPRSRATARLFVWLLCSAEILVGGLLLLNPRLGALLASLLLLGFMAFVVQWRRGVQVSGCGCSGSPSRRTNVASVLTVRAIAFLGAILILTAQPSGQATRGSLALRIAVATAATVLLAWRGGRVPFARLSHGTESPVGGDEAPRNGLSRRSVLARAAVLLGVGLVSPVLGALSPAYACPEECHSDDCCSYYYCKTDLCDPETICIEGNEYEKCIGVCTGSGSTCGSTYLVYTGESC